MASIPTFTAATGKSAYSTTTWRKRSSGAAAVPLVQSRGRPGQRAHDALELITGEAERLQSNAALARSIAHRFPYLDPLNHLQVELLRRYRQRSGRPDKGVESVERLQRGIHLSINGIAAGLRNTG